MQDIIELEVAIGANLWPLEQLKAPQRALRGFRRLLFIDSRAEALEPLLMELPRPIILHHLHSRGPAALHLPHTEFNLTYKQVGRHMLANSCELNTH